MCDELVSRARALQRRGGRRILGITGPPGAGKSTLAEAIVRETGAAYVPMDGFHLPRAELRRLGRLKRIGAPDTFDADGFVGLLREVRAADHDVPAPGFDRTVEEPVPGALVVPQRTPLVVVEGNYLLLNVPPWSLVWALLDEVWYLDAPENRRVAGLVERLLRHGKTRPEAKAFVSTRAERNARIIEATRHFADLVVPGWR